jgi:hypothetical protein
MVALVVLVNQTVTTQDSLAEPEGSLAVAVLVLTTVHAQVAVEVHSSL